MEIVQKIRFNQSSTTSAPASLLFGEPAFTDVGGVKKFFIGDASANVYLIKLSDYAPPDQALDLNSQKITNLADGSANSDAATWGQVQQLVNGLKWRSPVVVAVGTDVNLANPGTDTFDGVTLSQGDRLLLYGQTNDGENGIYIFDTSSTALARSALADTLIEIDTSAVMVDQGSKANGAYVLQVSDTGGVLGTETINVIPFANSTLDSVLQSIAGLSPAENDILYFNGSGYSTFTPQTGAVITTNSSGQWTSIQGNDGDLLVRVGGEWTTGNIINGGSF
jgi:hypothetical protein